jgi:hypothetical protein
MPIEDVARDGTQGDHISQPLIIRQAESNVEGHPVPDQEKTVDQVGVPA